MFNSEMLYKNLGHSGIKLSRLSLGGWLTFGGSLKDESLAQKIIDKAYQAGINFFDLADIYAKGEAEILMGKCLKSYPRHELVISSKAFWPMSDDVNDRGLSRKHIFESVDRSLARLKTDYLDIYFCHRFDPETPLEETARAMNDLVNKGKVLYWGTSEWSAQQIRTVSEICRGAGWHEPRVEQPQYNLLERKLVENEVGPAARDCGMGLVTWSPLASGILSGRYDQGFGSGRLSKVSWLKEQLATTENLNKIAMFKKISEAVGVSRSKLAIRYLLQNNDVTSVILGASNVEQLQENLDSLKVEISEKVFADIKNIFS
jgi:voltage-dependent potassium channel beta subunit